jgi:hypothetical protein
VNALNRNTPTLFGFPKLHPRYASVVMPLLLSVFMTCIVSMISTFRSLGAVPHVLRVWLGAWGISWLIAFPTLLLILPAVRRLTATLVRSP